MLRSISWHVLISLQQDNHLCTLSTHAHYTLRPPLQTWSKSNSAVQSPPWDVNSGLALKRLSTHFMEPTDSLTCLQEPATKLYPRQNKSSSHPSKPKSLLILCSYSSPRIWSSFFPSGFTNDILYAIIHSSMRDTCPSNSSPVTWSFKWQPITHTNYEVLHYTLLSSLTTLSYVQPSFLSVLYSESINPCLSLHATDHTSCLYKAIDNFYFVHLHLYIWRSYK